MSTGRRTGHINLVPVGFTVQIRLHAENAVLATVSANIQPLVFRIVLHVHGAPVVMVQFHHRAAVCHIPAGAIGEGQFRIRSIHRGFAAEIGVCRVKSANGLHQSLYDTLILPLKPFRLPA